MSSIYPEEEDVYPTRILGVKRNSVVFLDTRNSLLMLQEILYSYRALRTVK